MRADEASAVKSYDLCRRGVTGHTCTSIRRTLMPGCQDTRHLSSMQANIHSEGTLHCGVEEADIQITHSTAVVSMLWIKTMKSFKHRRITIWAIRGVGARARSPVSPGAWCDCRDSRPSSPHHLHQAARIHYVANTGRFRILMLRRFAKPLEGPGGSGYPPILRKKEWDV